MKLADEKQKCKKRVYSGEHCDFSGHQCSHNAWKDGYCKMHHPETVKAKNDASQAKWEAEYEARRANDPHIKLAEANKRIEELVELLSSIPCIKCGLFTACNMSTKIDAIYDALKRAKAL